MKHDEFFIDVFRTYRALPGRPLQVLAKGRSIPAALHDQQADPDLQGKKAAQEGEEASCRGGRMASAS